MSYFSNFICFHFVILNSMFRYVTIFSFFNYSRYFMHSIFRVVVFLSVFSLAFSW